MQLNLPYLLQAFGQLPQMLLGVQHLVLLSQISRKVFYWRSQPKTSTTKYGDSYLTVELGKFKATCEGKTDHLGRTIDKMKGMKKGGAASSADSPAVVTRRDDGTIEV